MNKPIQMAQIQLDKEEIDAAVGVLKTGSLRQGKVCNAFENKFSEEVGAKYALTCSSGTAALHLAYMACLKPDDEVLVPTFTFFATASMVTMTGCRPVFCDVDPETWLIDLKDAEGRITQKTRAIAPVHLFGNACPADEIIAFAEKHDLFIIWDAAQAHGTHFNGKDIGGLNDLVCYSFYPTKNMFTGEGGMVTTNNWDYFEKIKLLRSHGQKEKYCHTMIGMNYRMTDVEASIGIKQLERLKDKVTIRRRNARVLTDELSNIEGISLQQAINGSEHSYHQFCIIVDKESFGMDRDALALKLKEKGIGTGVHYPRGLHQQPVFKDLYTGERLPVSEKLCEQILALPVHPGLEEEDCFYIAKCIGGSQKQGAVGSKQRYFASK